VTLEFFALSPHPIANSRGISPHFRIVQELLHVAHAVRPLAEPIAGDRSPGPVGGADVPAFAANPGIPAATIGSSRWSTVSHIRLVVARLLAASPVLRVPCLSRLVRLGIVLSAQAAQPLLPLRALCGPLATSFASLPVSAFSILRLPSTRLFTRLPLLLVVDTIRVLFALPWPLLTFLLVLPRIASVWPLPLATSGGGALSGRVLAGGLGHLAAQVLGEIVELFFRETQGGRLVAEDALGGAFDAVA
jgi:hypothetical protein